MACIKRAAFAVAATTLSAAGLAMPAAHADTASTGPHYATTFVGAFTFEACPAGSAAGDFCLTDTLTGGSLPGVGPVVGHFFVDIHYGEFGTADCGPIDKHGEFTAADGSTLNVVAAGELCKSTGTVDYKYVAAGGTGRLRYAFGWGDWSLPAASQYTSTGGWGYENLSGSLYF